MNWLCNCRSLSYWHFLIVVPCPIGMKSSIQEASLSVEIKANDMAFIASFTLRKWGTHPPIDGGWWLWKSSLIAKSSCFMKFQIDPYEKLSDTGTSSSAITQSTLQFKRRAWSVKLSPLILVNLKDRSSISGMGAIASRNWFQKWMAEFVSSSLSVLHSSS